MLSSGTAPTSDPAGAGIATAFADGREIRVSSAGSVSLNVNGSTAKIAIGGQSVTVERSRLLLDGRALGDVPPETRKVEVSMVKGMLFIRGDGRELARARMDK
ncbi:MAG: hypothetical protein ACO1TE_18705 [Prosthecobacter sp.]